MEKCECIYNCKVDKKIVETLELMCNHNCNECILKCLKNNACYVKCLKETV